MGGVGEHDKTLADGVEGLVPGGEAGEVGGECVILTWERMRPAREERDSGVMGGSFRRD
jgi:hypothetical protein